MSAQIKSCDSVIQKAGRATVSPALWPLLPIYYQLAPRARGLGRKVHKLKRCKLEAGKRLWIEKQHAFRPITTRTYYKGLHRLEILANVCRLGGSSSRWMCLDLSRGPTPTTKNKFTGNQP